MPNFWNKIKSFFQPEIPEDNELEEIDISYPEELPLDEKFVSLFTQGGGSFLYCETLAIAAKYLNEIVRSEQICRIICFDKGLQKILNTLGINYIEHPSASADASFIGCESLVAYNGSVVLSYHQSGGRNVKDLPNTFIVYATLSQIEPTLKDAMTSIKKNKSDNIPSGITSIGGISTNQLEEENIIKPLIYLLLVEDE